MRHSLTKERYAALAAQIQRHEDALDIRAARRLKLLLEEEEIVHLPGETIYGWRTVSTFRISICQVKRKNCMRLISSMSRDGYVTFPVTGRRVAGWAAATPWNR